MTVRSLLQIIDLAGRGSHQNCSDEESRERRYMLIVDMEGHGNLLNAKVEGVRLRESGMYLTVRGTQERVL